MASGRTELAAHVLVALAAVAAVTDLFRGKIYNWLTLPGIVAGMAASAATGGLSALGQSALAVLLGLALYGWLFGLGVLGGGDVKLLMAFGAWGGVRYVADVALLGILLGGVLSAGHLVVRGRAVAFARKLYRFLLSVLVRELVLETPAVDRKLTLPFGVPMAIAATWVVFDDPLRRWGMMPW